MACPSWRTMTASAAPACTTSSAPTRGRSETLGRRTDRPRWQPSPPTAAPLARRDT